MPTQQDFKRKSSKRQRHSKCSFPKKGWPSAEDPIERAQGVESITVVRGGDKGGTKRTFRGTSKHRMTNWNQMMNHGKPWIGRDGPVSVFWTAETPARRTSQKEAVTTSSTK